MKTKALFKQVVKLEQIDPLWSISGEKKEGPYPRDFEKQSFWKVLKMLAAAPKLKIREYQDLLQ